MSSPHGCVHTGYAHKHIHVFFHQPIPVGFLAPCARGSNINSILPKSLKQRRDWKPSVSTTQWTGLKRLSLLIVSNWVWHSPGDNTWTPPICLIYITDITKSVRNSTLIMYADDCTSLVSADDVQQAMTNAYKELNNAATWFQANKMSLNTSKTKGNISDRSPTKYPVYHDIWLSIHGKEN